MKLYLSVHNDINPLLPSDPSKYTGSEEKMGKWQACQKLPVCDNSIASVGFVLHFSWKNAYSFKENNCSPKNF